MNMFELSHSTFRHSIELESISILSLKIVTLIFIIFTCYKKYAENRTGIRVLDPLYVLYLNGSEAPNCATHARKVRQTLDATQTHTGRGDDRVESLLRRHMYI